MKRDVLWGYLSQFLQYGAALLVLPLLLRKFSSAELGVWYVFVTISALVNMLDMGFTQTLARNVAYVMGGAKNLQAEGYEIVNNVLEVDYGLMKSIIDASKYIFSWISAAALLLMAVPGSIYIIHITKNQIDFQVVIIAWAVFSISTVTNIFYKYYTPLLQGRGLFAEFYKANALASLGFVVVTSTLLEFELGILSVAIGYLLSAFIGRWLSWFYFYDRSFKMQLKTASTAKISLQDICKLMWHNSWRLGLGVVGAFFILRANTLLSSVYLGLATTAAYALTLQIFSVLQSVSTVVFNVYLPKLTRCRVTNQRQEFIRVMEAGFKYALGIFLLGAVLISLFGEFLIKLVGGKTELLPTSIVSLMALMMLLELNHSLAAGVIVTGNNVPFVKPALLSGFLIVAISWIGLNYFESGVFLLVFSQFIVQLAFNNWKWPYVIYCEYYKPSLAAL